MHAHAQVRNPSTSEVIAKVPQMKANETKAAIAAASAAWPAWCKKTAKERGAIMRKCALPLSLLLYAIICSCEGMLPGKGKARVEPCNADDILKCCLGHPGLAPWSPSLMRVHDHLSVMRLLCCFLL